MPSRRLLLVSIAAITLVTGLVLACAKKDGDAPPATPSTPSAYQATLRSLLPGDTVRSTSTFAVGETVRAELTLTNISGQVRNDPSSVLVWYLDVRRADGTLVRAEDRLGAATSMIAIQPGLPYTSQHEWGQADAGNVPVGAGDYVLTAVSVAGSVSVPITIAPAPVSRN